MNYKKLAPAFIVLIAFALMFGCTSGSDLLLIKKDVDFNTINFSYDGGFANSVYLPNQLLDGGDANSIFS